jgi:Phage tail lysozyme
MGFISDWLANLDNPEARGAMVNDAIGTAAKKVFPGAVKSPAGGTTPAPARAKPKASEKFLAFANDRQAGADALATEAGFAPPAPEPTVTYPVSTSSSSGADPASIFRDTLLSDAGGVALPQHVVDGIMMNVHDESGGDPGIYGDNGAAVGLLQWNGERQRNLKQFADDNSIAYNDPRLQGLFTKHELLTSERGAYDALMKTSTPGEAGAVFVDQFERPAEEHRLARRAKYLGGQGNADFVSSGVGLDYGPELSAVDPMSPELTGRGAGGYSMSGDFETLRDKFAQRPAANIAAANAQSQQPYDDAILRFLREGAEETDPSVVPTATPALAAMGLSGDAGDYSMGTPVGAQPAGGSSSDGGGASRQQPAAVAAEDTAKPKLTAVDRMMNAVYGTAVEDMTADERADRRRAVGMAMTQGFQMLSRGTPMDIQPIVQQRMELQQVRRAASDLKNNAQGVSDMLVAAGMDELAQLPFMGENGMAAALQSLTNVSTARATADGVEGPFDVSPTMRATMAQTMADMGYEGPAQLIMNTEAGPAFKELWDNAVGVTTRAATDESGATANPLTPEEVAAGATILRSNNNPMAADMLEQGLISRTDLSKIALEAGKAPIATQQALEVEAGKAAISAEEDAAQVERLAAGLAAANMPPELVQAVKDSGSFENAQAVIAAAKDADTVSREQQSIAERGKAMADMIPADAPNAAALKAAALNAETTGDLQIIFDELAKDMPTEKIRTLQALKDNPDLFEVMKDAAFADLGKDRSESPSATLLRETMIMPTLAKFGEGTAMRNKTVADMKVLQERARDPTLSLGVLQGTALVPMQQIADSILGVNVVNFADAGGVTMQRMTELVQNNNFAAASALLSGAISNMESETFKRTFPSITDSRLQYLAVTQYQIKGAELAQAEYEATLEWIDETKGTKEAGSMSSLTEYVEKKVSSREDLKIFKPVKGTMESIAKQVAAGVASGKYEQGEVVLGIDAETGQQTYILAGEYND